MNWLTGIFRRKLEALAKPDRETLDSWLRTAYDHFASGNPVEAERRYRELLEHDPRDADALYFLAVMAISGGRALEATDLCQRAIEIRPNDAGFWFCLAVACHHQRRLEEAVDAWRRVLALDPEYNLARNNLGATLIDLGLAEGGREELERLLASGYENSPLRYNLGVVYRDQARIDDSIAACRRALELVPDNAAAYTNYLLSLNYSEPYDEAKLFVEHRRFGARFAKPYVEPQPDISWPRRLRVGYVSPDFRNHVVSCFIEPILAHHDRASVEIFCYHCNRWEDHVTERLRALVEHWVEGAHMSDRDLTERVRADRIDILVDLAGHTGDNRLHAFSEKPAPVQISYLGYPGTTGLSAIDYRISDARADPPGEADSWSVERLLRPWPTYFCYRPRPDCPDVGPLPARAAGHATFGCFNNLPKVSGAFLDAAGQVLAAVPGSRLRLKARALSIAHVADRIRERFRRAGIDLTRVDLVGWEETFGGHLEAYRSIDIALDSFPYNGATTTCEALWMGVPVVTFSGDRHAGRMGASLLCAIGLEELVARDVAGYVKTCIALANDLERLEDLRNGLRERVRRSPLTDEAGFTRALERCYIDIWEQKIRADPSASKLDNAAIAALMRKASGLHTAGKKLDAEEACKEILKNRPDHMEALTALWDLSYETGNHGVAVEWLRRGIAANDGIARLHYMIGYSLMGQGNMADAAGSFRKALALDPSMAKAHNNLGCALEAIGQLSEAVECYRRAIGLDPQLADALYNLGNVHRQLGQVDQAIEYVGQALQLDSRRADWKCNLGDLLCQVLRLDEAIEAYEGSIAINASDARAHAGRANALQLLGRADEAESAYRKAIELDPDNTRINSDWLLCLHYRRGDQSLLEEHLAWAKRHACGFGREIARAEHERRPDRRMNICYMSPDFKRHSVACFLEPLLAAHDRSRFKIFCYSNTVFQDAVTQRIRNLCEEWRDFSRVTDDWVVERMRADRIDILVDLAGHSGEGRLLLFARKLAPVQVTWLGYPNTTGLAAIDYRLTDAIADPEGGTERFHVERLVRLENGFLCFGAPSESPPVQELPSLKAGHVTFGCFNNLAKLTPAMIGLWAQLLNLLPQARLKLKSFGLAAESARSSICERFSNYGIAPDRLELSGPEDSLVQHLGKYDGVDIALDVFPYAGVATTCEALWMGVPVITLAGTTHVSRVGASILNRVGLSDLVASTAEEYVHKAQQLAGDINRLRTLRATMRDRMLASPLLDAKGFARSLENAYCEMWDRWVENEEAQEALHPDASKVANAA